jgi:hypothetical protein
MRVMRTYEILPLFNAHVVTRPSQSTEHPYAMTLQLTDIGDVDDLQVTQVTTVSPGWRAAPVSTSNP